MSDPTAPPVRRLLAGAGAQAALLLGLHVWVGLDPVGWVAGALYTAAATLLVGRAMRRHRPGPADAVTSLRTVLVGGATALAVQGGPPWPLVALAALALALDLVDGYVARRSGTASAFGARYDMEVDSFALVAVGVYVAGQLGPWVLLVGAARYVFWAASALWPWLSSPLPERRSRKLVAAFQGLALVVAAVPVVPVWISSALVAAALTALVWSFARDVRWLWLRQQQRQRHPVGKTTASTLPPRKG